MKIKKLLKYGFSYIADNKTRFEINSYLGLYKNVPDEKYLKKKFRFEVGYDLDLANPKTFNEKLQWLKLYDRNPLYTTLVDKYAVKDYVANIIGNEYIIPTLGVYDSFDDIDFTALPNSFVLKCTHDSGSIVICKDKNSFMKNNKGHYSSAKRKLTKALKRNFFWSGREWPYKNVKPRIMAEKYMKDDKTAELRDYKFFCFDGIAKALFIATDRQKIRDGHNSGEDTKFDFYDMDFKHLDIRNGHDNADIPPAKPECFEEMKRCAEILSQKIPHLRVDFYEVNGKAYFGELTFSHWSGMVPFEPEEWDATFGSWIKLPEVYNDTDLKDVDSEKDFRGGYLNIGNSYVLWLHQGERGGKKERGEPKIANHMGYAQDGGLIDYKFFCFNGKAELLYISKGLENHSTAMISFYTLDGTELPFHRKDYKPFHDAPIPDNISEMENIANKLATEIASPFVRVDLYSLKGKTYFSEITFYPCSGYLPFFPLSADLQLGEMINIRNL